MTPNEVPLTNRDPFYETQSIAVPEAFEEFFTHFYYAANHTPYPVHKKLIPSFQTILVFNLGSKISISFDQNPSFDAPHNLIVGPIKKTIDYSLSPGAEMLVANFKWDAFYRFFGQSLKSFNEFIIEPDDLVKEQCFADVWIRLKEAPSLAEKIDLLLNFSLPYLRERKSNVAQVLAQNEANGAINTVKKIAAESGYSERNIQLNYQKYLGFSDKELNRYQRFKKAVELLSKANATSQPIDWLEIVAQCGYYDQSQLIHDFNHFIKMSPTHYLKLQEDLCMTAL